MANDNELLIRINGSAKNFTDELDRVKKKTADLEKSLTQVAKISTAAFVGLAAAIGGTVARFASFEKGFTNVVTLLDKTSFSSKTLEKGIDSLKNGVIELGARSGESFDNLNQGLFNLISAGVPAEKSMAALGAATELAIAGATTTDVAVKALTASLTSFGDSAGNATEIAEKFFTAQKFGVTTVGELATEFNKVAGVSNELGISFDEILASLSSLTANGAKPTAVAATDLRRALTAIVLVQKDLGKESAAVQDALSLQGIRTRGLVPSLNLLKEAVNGDVVELQRLLGSAPAVSAALSLTGAQAELFQKQMDALGNATERATTFQDALAVKQQTVSQATARLGSSIDAVAVTFGEVFAPLINKAADALSAIAQAFSTLSPTAIRIIAVIAGLTTVLLGMVSAVTLSLLAYIKIDRTLKVVNSTFGLTTKATAIYNATLTAGRRAVDLFRRGVVLATTTVRGFAAATGIGLVILALSLMITNLEKTRAVASGVFAAVAKILDNFVKVTQGRLSALGDILIGVFTLDKDRIAKGINDLGESLKNEFSNLGKGVGEAYSDAFNTSLEQSEAAKLPPPEEVPLPPGLDEPDSPRDPASDGRGEKLLKQEREAAARLREIRARENELLNAQARQAANERVDIKDEELKRLQDEENKAGANAIKVKQDQLNILKQIDSLESKNVELSAKQKRSAKEQVELEANQKELDTLAEQLANLRSLETQNNELIALEQQERDARKLERIQEQAEEEALLREELNLLSQEQRDLLDEEDIEKARQTIQTKRDIEKEAAAEQLADNIKRRKQFIKDETDFGTNFAKIKQFFSSQEVQLADQTAGQLVQLTQSKNSQLKAIGKAASLVQIGIKTAEGAISAYAALAGIPIIGPALGTAAAAALIAFGAEQAAAVVSAQRGGIVPEGIGSANDRIPALLQPGELIVPAPLVPDFIQSVGRPELGGEDGGGSQTEVVIGFTDEAIPFIEQKLLERRAIGSGSL